MSSNLILLPVPRLTKRSTMADVLEHVFADESLPDKKRMNIRWAFRTLGKAIGRPLHQISADPRYLSEQLDKITAAMVRLTEGGWANGVALIRFALRYVGIIKVPARRTVPFAPEWSRLMASMTLKHDQIGLSRLARHCTVAGIDPNDVTDEVFTTFLEELTEDTLLRQPHKVHRRAAVIWNKMARTTRNWPTQTVTVPSYSKVYFIGWDKFPASLSSEVEAHLRSLDGSDPFRNLEIKPLKPSSIRTRRLQLGAYLSALVLEGEKASDLTSLAAVTTIPRVKKGLNFFLNRSYSKSKRQAYETARLLLSIARHTVKAPPNVISDLQTFCKRLNEAPGMGRETRNRLRQFDDQENVVRLYNFPRDLVEQAKRIQGKPTQAAALLVQTAVAIELLLMIPIRRDNLTHLDLGKHITRHPSGKTYLLIPGEEVKNGVDIEALLPQQLADLIELYSSAYRPVLEPDHASTWMFPGRTGCHKSRERLALQISETIKKQLGLLVNVHLFRAISAKVYLDRNPGGYGIIKNLHGHKSLETTIRSYCGLEGKSAIAHFDKFIIQERKTVAPAPSGRARRKAVAPALRGPDRGKDASP